MTARETFIALVAGGFMVLFAGGLAGYFLVYEPLQEKREQAATLSAEVDDLNRDLAKAKKQKPQLQTALLRSLPANKDVARTEYDAAISKILRDAKVPRSAITVRPRSVDGKPTPEVAPKKPAFERLAVAVDLKPVSLAHVIDVLRGYYELNLLQQITKFTVKKLDGKDYSPAELGSRFADVADLDVSFITEAIILDGAAPRRSLIAVPDAFAAIGGVAGQMTIEHSPKKEVARGLTPLQLAATLASNNRDYSLILVKDIFHGPTPGPKPVVVAEVPPPKEDTSEFIRLTGLGINPDGSGTAVIEDLASKQEYLVNQTWVESKLASEVTKFYYTIRGQRRAYEPEPTLLISESSSGTNRKFRVVGFADGGMVLADLLTAATPAARSAGGGRTRGGPPAAASGGPPLTPPVAAVAGGTALPQPPERVYLWKLGQTLSQITELKGTAKDKAMRAAQGLPETPDGAAEAAVQEKDELSAK